MLRKVFNYIFGIVDVEPFKQAQVEYLQNCYRHAHVLPPSPGKDQLIRSLQGLEESVRKLPGKPVEVVRGARTVPHC
jgi:hypothetical protein